MEDLKAQAKILQPLKAMLELDGYDCASSTEVGGVIAPLSIRQGGKTLCVGTLAALLDDQADGVNHPLYVLDGQSKTRVLALNEYFLTRNLPGAAEQVFRMLK
jgi:hypothetical protein